MPMSEAKYSFNVPLPKNSTYDASAQLTVRADHAEELKNSIDVLFGAGTYDRVTALGLQTILSLPTGTAAAPASAPTAGVASTPPQAAPAPVVPADTGSASDSRYPPKQVYGSCPECGVGNIVDKFRTAAKGGGFMGRGCDNYPDCQHMQFWAQR